MYLYLTIEPGDRMSAGSKIRILLDECGRVKDKALLDLEGLGVKSESLTHDDVRLRGADVYGGVDGGHVEERLSRLATRIERSVWSGYEAGAARVARSDEFIRLCAAEVFGEEWTGKYLGSLRRKEGRV